MAQNFGNAFLQPPHKSGAAVLKAPAGAAPKRPAQHPAQQPAERKLTFAKIFRWRLPDGQTQEPAAVEIAGTFTNWQKVPLIYEHMTRVWQLALQNIPINRTHHYMLLADGKPVQDEHSDGMAIPTGAQELQFAITTIRGPRVFMLFSQAK
jgi:hypothetical protein